MRLHIQPWGGEGHGQAREDGTYFEALVAGDPEDGVYELVAVCPNCEEGLLHEGCRYYAIGNSVCTKCGEYVPCPSCSVEPKQTEQNMRGQHDDHPERRLERAADIIRRNTVRTSDLISIGEGRYGVAEWELLEPKEQEAWISLARKVVRAAEEAS